MIHRAAKFESVLAPQITQGAIDAAKRDVENSDIHGVTTTEGDHTSVDVPSKTLVGGSLLRKIVSLVISV